MYHIPPSKFLYSAYKIYITFTNGTTTKTRTATGFVIGLKNNIPYIVTNRHVVDLNYNLHSIDNIGFSTSTFELIGRNSDDNLIRFKMASSAKIYFHPIFENDVVLIEGKILLEGDQFHFHFGMNQIADSNVYSSLIPYDHICYSGFPSQHDKLNQRPILRSGKIASDPQHEYSWDSKNRGQCVAYEGFSFEGSSGSPIFAVPRQGSGSISNLAQGYVIGVNAGHIPEQYQHSGISYFYKSTVIYEIANIHNLI